MSEKKSKMSLKAIIQFIILGIGAYIIYQPIYEKNTYYEAFIQGFNITNTQFATMFSAFSIVSLISNIPGGIIADKFSPRKLLTFSFISTAILALWESTFPSYMAGVFIFGAMGATTTLTFWAALIKATRQFGQSMAGESKALGFQEGVRNVGKMLIATVAVWLFSRHASIENGLATVLRYDAIITFLCGIASWFVFSDDTGEESAVYKEGLVKQIAQCFKNPAVWVVALIVLGTYSMSANLSGYVTKIGTSKFSLSVQMAAVGVMISTYMQPVGSFIGGWLGDKLGATKALALSTIGLMAATATVLLLPKSPAMAVPFIITYLIFTGFRGAARGQYYGPLREAGVPMALSGTATGLIATIGYSGDTFLPIVSGKLLDTMDATAAMERFIMILLAFGALSLIMTLVMFRLIKKRSQKETQQ